MPPVHNHQRPLSSTAPSWRGGYRFQYLYAYYPNGNWSAQQHDGTLTSYTIGDNNELRAAGASSLTYDQFGNTLTNGLFTYTWDFEGHMLTGVRSGLPTSTDTHEYDGDGRRMRSKWNNAGDWTNFVYDEIEGSHPAILAEYTFVSGTFTIRSLNTHGIGLINTNREGTKRYFHFDGLGSTWALTDGSEVVQDTYTWSAFGVQEASTGSSVNPFRYVGQFGYYDDTARGSTLGLRCLGVRYYSPSLGRLLSWDSLPADNPYFYAGNQPVHCIDPSGKFIIIAIGAVLLIGALVGCGRGRPKPSYRCNRSLPECDDMCKDVDSDDQWGAFLADCRLCCKAMYPKASDNRCIGLCQWLGNKKYFATCRC